jgi:multidrug efflux system membrane fusion protein
MKGGFPWKTAVVVILLLILTGVYVIRHKNASSADTKGGPGSRRPTGPISVVIGTVEKKDLPIYLDSLGTVQAFNTVTVRGRVDGTVQKIAFQEGQDVHAGDVLAQIDPAPFKTQVQQAEAKKGQDDAQLENANVELKRDASLLASKILAQEVYDTQKALVKQLEASVRADQASIDSANVQLNYASVKAPISGRTGLRLVDEGNVIRTSDSNGIVVLTQIHPISVVFTLPEQFLREVHRHQDTNASVMKVLAVDRDNKTVLDEGQLAVVDNQIDTTTGTIRLKATFPNQDLQLWPGQFVNVRLLLNIRKAGAVVPASVIQRGPDGPYAFVVHDDMHVAMAPVQVGQAEQDDVLIEKGLEPGQKVVVDGQYKLQPGMEVKAAEANPNIAEKEGTNSRPASAGANAGGRKKGPPRDKS